MSRLVFPTVSKQEGGRLPKSTLETHVRWDPPITLASLTERLRQAGAGANDLKQILEDRNEELATRLCGPRHHPTNEKNRRWGHNKRSIITLFGRVDLRLQQVRDMKSGHVFVPLWQDIQIQKLRQYQDDFVAVAISHAQRMTYRNAAEELSHTTGVRIGASTLNRRVKEHGSDLHEHLRHRSIEAEAVVPDGTKLRSQKKGHEELRISITENQDGATHLRCLTVGLDWLNHRFILNNTHFIDAEGNPGPPRITTDGEPGLADVFMIRDARAQACLIHLDRALGYALWRDGLFKNDEDRRSTVKQVQGLLRHLRNSVALHIPRGETDEVRHRIEETRKGLVAIVEELRERGLWQAANSLEGFIGSATVFASLALEGYWMPWHTNRVERVMLEVAKRCKHRGMRWTDKGSMALLALLVFRFLEPKEYEAWWEKRLHGPARFKRDYGIEVIVTGGTTFKGG